jgi:hypothetical protein
MGIQESTIEVSTDSKLERKKLTLVAEDFHDDF